MFANYDYDDDVTTSMESLLESWLDVTLTVDQSNVTTCSYESMSLYCKYALQLQNGVNMTSEGGCPQRQNTSLLDECKQYNQVRSEVIKGLLKEGVSKLVSKLTIVFNNVLSVDRCNQLH